MNRTLNLVDGVQLVGASITPRYDLLRSYVNITFERVDTFNGVQQAYTTDQSWPSPLPTAFGGLDTTVRLIGSSLRVTLVTVTTAELGNLSDPGAAAALLLLKHPYLGDAATVASFVVNGAPTRKSTKGYGNYVVPSSAQLTNWMTKADGSAVNTDRDTLTFQVQVTSVNGHVENKVLTAEITATDLDTGGAPLTFRKVTGSPTQEQPPPNLAEDMWDALSVLQWTGAVTLAPVDGECDTESCWLGDVVSLGDVPQYSAMEAVVQSVTLDIDAGRTTVKFGPNRLLSAGDYVELLRVTRYRVVFQDSSAKNATLQTPDTTSIGDSTGTENSAGGAGFREVVVASENADGSGGRITHDAPNATLTLEVDRDKLIQMLYDDAQGQQIRFRIYNVCVPDGSGGTTTKKAILLGSLPF